MLQQHSESHILRMLCFSTNAVLIPNKNFTLISPYSTYFILYFSAAPQSHRSNKKKKNFQWAAIVKNKKVFCKQTECFNVDFSRNNPFLLHKLLSALIHLAGLLCGAVVRVRPSVRPSVRLSYFWYTLPPCVCRAAIDGHRLLPPPPNGTETTEVDC